MLSVTTYLDHIICAQAYWPIYPVSTTSLELFQNNYSKSMLLGMVPPQEKLLKYSVPTIPKMKLSIDAE